MQLADGPPTPLAQAQLQRATAVRVPQPERPKARERASAVPVLACPPPHPVLAQHHRSLHGASGRRIAPCLLLRRLPQGGTQSGETPARVEAQAPGPQPRPVHRRALPRREWRGTLGRRAPPQAARRGSLQDADALGCEQQTCRHCILCQDVVLLSRASSSIGCSAMTLHVRLDMESLIC